MKDLRWIEAMKGEITTLEEKGTWSLWPWRFTYIDQRFMFASAINRCTEVGVKTFMREVSFQKKKKRAIRTSNLPLVHVLWVSLVTHGFEYLALYFQTYKGKESAQKCWCYNCRENRLAMEIPSEWWSNTLPNSVSNGVQWKLCREYSS